MDDGIWLVPDEGARALFRMLCDLFDGVRVGRPDARASRPGRETRRRAIEEDGEETMGSLSVEDRSKASESLLALAGGEQVPTWPTLAEAVMGTRQCMRREVVGRLADLAAVTVTEEDHERQQEIIRDLQRERDEALKLVRRLDKTRLLIKQVLSVATEMEHHVSGVEGGEDSPVARWALRLRDTVRCSAEFAEDARAAKLAREYGGVDGLEEALANDGAIVHAVVSALWPDGAPDEGAGNEEIARELDRRLLTDEDAKWVREHGGVGFLEIHLPNLWSFIDHIMDRLGVDKSDIDGPELVDEELDHRLMPPGYEWPRFDDGGMVEIGGHAEEHGDVIEITHVTVSRTGVVLQGVVQGDEDCQARYLYRPGERVKRPKPAPVGDDGLSIEKDETVAASYLADMVDPEPERTCRLVPMAWNGAPPYRGTGVVLDALTMGCSECGYPIMAGFRKVPNYCPNCGAKVVGDD